MAGRARIAVRGIQDQWLSGDPSYSYFVTIFRRHTRFSTETVELPFTGDFKLGSNLRSIVPNNVGDLVRSMTLKLRLGTLPTNTSTEKHYYNIPVAKNLLKHVDLKMGGQTIERLTGEYITMYDQLHSNKDDVAQTLYFLNGQGNHLTVSGSYDTFYVNLPFYFFRNPSLAIPVCALKKQMIEIELTFKDIDDDVTFKYTIQGDGNVTREVTEDGRILNASVLVDFFFVTEDERNYLLTRPMDYLITQLQVSTVTFKPNETKKSALLKFINPVKELFFLAKEETGTTNVIESTDTISQLGNDIDSEAAGDYSGTSVSMSSDGTRVAIGAILNDSSNGSNSGHVRVYDWNSGTSLWTQVGPDIDGEAADDQFGHSVSMSSDGMRVAIGAPFNDGTGSDAGHVRVYDWNSGTSVWTYQGQDIDGEAAGDESGWSVSMSSDGTRVAIGAYSNDANGSYSGHTRVYSLGAFLGTPGGSEDRLLNTTSSDRAFSTAIVGTGNVLKRSDYRLIKNIRLDFNGKNIFDYSGTYLAYGQSLKYHTGCPDPANEFYMYSFALDPEKYYPTGQVNMSRIIHKKIDIELDEVSTTRDIKVKVYALSYNILRIQGGLAGLKF